MGILSKIQLETIFLLIILGVLFYLILTLITPNSDNYVHYINAKKIMENPDILWSSVNNTPSYFLLRAEEGNTVPLSLVHPPLGIIIWAMLFSIGSSPILLDIISVFIIFFLVYKINKNAAFFLVLSYVLIRSSVWGGLDIFFLALATVSIYYFERNPEISGICAGLCPLVKLNGFFFFFAWLVARIFTGRHDFKSSTFLKSKTFISIVLAFLVLLPWYGRNFIYFGGNLQATVIGSTSNPFSQQEITLRSNNVLPEIYFFDTTGKVPLSLDLLLVIGLGFFVYNILKEYKTKTHGTVSRSIEGEVISTTTAEITSTGVSVTTSTGKAIIPLPINIISLLNWERIMIIILASFYFYFQATNFLSLMPLRYYIPILPLLAIQMGRTIQKESHLKILYLLCLLILIFFSINLVGRAFNPVETAMQNICPLVTDVVDSKPTYVIAESYYYVIYRCDLNATTIDKSKFVFDYIKGSVYNNETNTTTQLPYKITIV